jgi:hypothetical protein
MVGARQPPLATRPGVGMVVAISCLDTPPLGQQVLLTASWLAAMIGWFAACLLDRMGRGQDGAGGPVRDGARRAHRTALLARSSPPLRHAKASPKRGTEHQI